MATTEAKRQASAYYHLRPHPPATLLCAGAKDILICPKQSIRFGDELKALGAEVEAIIYPDVNHGYYGPDNPVEFKDTTLKIAGLYSKHLTQAPFDSADLNKELDTMLAGYFPLDAIPAKAVLGTWTGKRETLQFLEDGTGKQINRNKKGKPFTYIVSGQSIKLTMGETNTDYFMRNDQRGIYFIYPDGRYASNKEMFMRARD